MKRSRSLNAILFICVATFISSDRYFQAAGQGGATGQAEQDLLYFPSIAKKEIELKLRPPISRLGIKPKPEVVLFEMARINLNVITELKRVWRLAGAGSHWVEGFVLVLKKPDGTYEAQSLGLSNEYKKFTFKWNPETVAIAHTHPNNNDPRPSGSDLDLSDRYRIPIFTLTSRGMYMYDPHTRKITLIHKGLDWLDPLKWAFDKLAWFPG